MSDFWKPDLSTVEKRTQFGIELAISLLTDQCDPVRIRKEDNGFRWVELGFGDGKRVDTIQLLAIEVLRHHASGQQTPPHLAASFLDECMATIGDEDRPVTELWLSDRGFVNEHDYPNWHVKDYKLPNQEDASFAFYILKADRQAIEWGVNDELRDQSVWFKTVPTVRQVLTVGRVLGIPTERRV